MIELDAELRLLEAAQQEPVCKFCGGTGFSGISDPCICQFSNAAQQAQEAVAPKWYSRNEIIHILRRMKYSEETAQELADWMVRHLQLAFNKGFQIGSRRTAPPTDSAAMLRAAGICRRVANENDGIVVGFNLYSQAASDCADAIEQALRTTPADVVLVPINRYQELVDCCFDMASGKGGWDWQSVVDEHNDMIAAAKENGK